MATQSLYRRYRPRRFAELKGQDHVVRALRTAVAEGREGQAYLFSGPRGTGKTTTARILAKVLNCANPQGGEPCCECESCLAVERGTSYDVHELDAASNNGVDAMRDLIEKASLGTPGRHKVYILDEVHMLSKGAEAALLKTLEEPPPHVVFVLATTDPQKMSDTIRSRTQHLQFHLLPADTLDEHVRWVAADAGLDVSDAAIDQALAQGAGSARDTLSALELVANAGDDAHEVVAFDELVDAMIDHDAGRALTVVAAAIGRGRDPRTLTEQLVGYLRDGFLSLMAPELVQVPSNRLDALADQARRFGPAGLVRGIEVLGGALGEMRHAPDPRVLLDVAVVKLTSPVVSDDVAALVARVRRLEEQVATGATGTPVAESPAPAVDPTTGRAALGGRARRFPRRPAASAPAPATPSAQSEAAPAPAPPAAQSEVAPASAPPAAQSEVAPAPAPPSAQSEAAPAPAPPAAQSEAAPAAGPPTEDGLTAETWDAARRSLRGLAKAVFMPAAFLGADGGSIRIELPNDVHRAKCEQQRAAAEEALAAVAGRPVALELVVADAAGAAAPAGDPGGEGAPVAAPEVPPDAPSDAPSNGVPDAPPAGAPADAVALPADADVDLDDLVDAPPESVKTPIDRLAEAFPGSEFVDESR